MLAGERIIIPPKEHTLRRSHWNEDCKRTALWRRPHCMRGPKGQSGRFMRLKQDQGANLSGKRTERCFHPEIG